MRGGVKGCLELFRKFIRFGGAGHPLIMKDCRCNAAGSALIMIDYCLIVTLCTVPGGRKSTRPLSTEHPYSVARRLFSIPGFRGTQKTHVYLFVPRNPFCSGYPVVYYGYLHPFKDIVCCAAKLITYHAPPLMWSKLCWSSHFSSWPSPTSSSLPARARADQNSTCWTLCCEESPGSWWRR